MEKSIIVIPCYNEAKRLDIQQYTDGLSRYTDVEILFVDDGSKDETLSVLNILKQNFPLQVHILPKIKNEGKAAAIYDGMNHSFTLDSSYSHIGYIDADLAVSIDEFVRLKGIAIDENKCFVFGSRWRRIGADIQRSFYRHVIGRVFATTSSNLLDLAVYDTQCGAKVFNLDIAKFVFQEGEKFSVNWLFDVEIFFRLLKKIPSKQFSEHCLEIPLQKWTDIGGSKVKFTHFISVLKDFWTLYKIYK